MWVLGAVAACMLLCPSIVQAGAFDYGLYLPYNNYNTRGVAHDYSYLRVANGSDFNLGLARGNGITFFGGYFVDHHYADSCNPSSCLTWYLQYTHDGSPYDSGDIHDEWR